MPGLMLPCRQFSCCSLALAGSFRSAQPLTEASFSLLRCLKTVGSYNNCCTREPQKQQGRTPLLAARPCCWSAGQSSTPCGSSAPTTFRPSWLSTLKVATALACGRAGGDGVGSGACPRTLPGSRQGAWLSSLHTSGCVATAEQQSPAQNKYGTAGIPLTGSTHRVERVHPHAQQVQLSRQLGG